MNLNIDFTSKKFIISSSGLGLIVVGLLLYFLVFSGSGPESSAAQLAVCLSDQGVTMYGLPTCPHCQEQKDKFGDSFKHVNYVNCSKNREKCLNKGIKTVPTWIIDGKKVVGVQELEELAEKTGCKYP
ncbi:MAG: glutaredoxin family protein [Candidatus Bipolaricaulia bacterium]